MSQVMKDKRFIPQNLITAYANDGENVLVTRTVYRNNATDSDISAVRMCAEMEFGLAANDIIMKIEGKNI